MTCHGEGFYVPETEDHSDCENLVKSYDELSESEMNMVSHRQIVYKDVKNALASFKNPHRTEEKEALDDWGRKYATNLTTQMEAVGVTALDISNC